MNLIKIDEAFYKLPDVKFPTWACALAVGGEDITLPAEKVAAFRAWEKATAAVAEKAVGPGHVCEVAEYEWQCDEEVEWDAAVYYTRTPAFGPAPAEVINTDILIFCSPINENKSEEAL